MDKKSFLFFSRKEKCCMQASVSLLLKSLDRAMWIRHDYYYRCYFTEA